MANKPGLNPKILEFLHQRLTKPVSTIRSDISRLRRNYPQSTLNAVAQVYAEQNGESVRRLISKEDKLSIPSVQFEKATTLKQRHAQL